MSTALILAGKIESKICFIRGKKVMLDGDLADLYGVETKALIQAVKRNLDRFPDDFMFRLSEEEYNFLRSQFVTSKKGRGGRRFMPYAFTEQGVAMLSSVLTSKRAVMVNIQIMRAFTKLRQMIESNQELREKIEEMEKKYDDQFKIVFEAIKRLIEPELKPKRKIGFYVADEEVKNLKSFKGIKFYDK